MFFKELSQLMMSDTGVSLTVHSQNGILTVSVFPKMKDLKDEAQQHLQPLVLTESAEELDTGFFDAIRQPVQKATGVLSGMKRFEESLARVEAEKKEAKELEQKQEQKRNSEKKALDKKARENMAKYDNFMSRADE
jgi:PRTRC genetic system protein E